jgi:hypothetical protein
MKYKSHKNEGKIKRNKTTRKTVKYKIYNIKFTEYGSRRQT